MQTPFSQDQFFQVFEQYNQAVFPNQIVILLLGVIAVLLLHSNFSAKSKLLAGFLGLLWMWAGLVYHIDFFSGINPAALVFGGIFVLQGALILRYLILNRLTFSFTRQFRSYVGYFLILFGLIIYPLIAYFANGSLNQTISLGLPCPTTIFSFGFFILADSKFPKHLLIIPMLWAVVGLSAAMNFGVYQDFMIIVSAIIAGIYVFRAKSLNQYLIKGIKSTKGSTACYTHRI